MCILPHAVSHRRAASAWVCLVCVCVYLHVLILYTPSHTHTLTFTAHTHDYQNVRHLSFNLIWLHLLSFVRLRLRSRLRLCLRYRHFLCCSLRFSTLSLPFLHVCVCLIVVVFCSLSLCSLSRKGVDACFKTCNLVGRGRGRPARCFCCYSCYYWRCCCYCCCPHCTSCCCCVRVWVWDTHAHNLKRFSLSWSQEMENFHK